MGMSLSRLEKPCGFLFSVNHSLWGMPAAMLSGEAHMKGPTVPARNYMSELRCESSSPAKPTAGCRRHLDCKICCLPNPLANSWLAETVRWETFAVLSPNVLGNLCGSRGLTQRVKAHRWGCRMCSICRLGIKERGLGWRYGFGNRLA